jgi:hypothetical protein
MTLPKDELDTSTVTLHLAYAEASVMLIESLTRLLIERGVIGLEEVIETFEATIEAKRVLGQEGDHPQIASIAAGILSVIANSIAAGRTRTAPSAQAEAPSRPTGKVDPD